MTIDTRAIPENESLVIEGNVVDDIWELSKSDIVKSAGPLEFKVAASIVDENLLVRGDFLAPFTSQCPHCLDTFKFSVNLTEHSLLLPIEGNSTIDLTNSIREDILLALPSFPNCEEGEENNRKCPASGKFNTEGDFEEIETKETKKSLLKDWEELNKLNLD
ncbi:MAG: hypothetical protein OSB44_05950 [Verrucomicrobiales bacterium]|nr:hypothetical protein [Verrucomicrobiales bacterium]